MTGRKVSGRVDAVAREAPVRGRKRPRQLTPAVRAKFLEGLEQGWSVSRAAQLAGVWKQHVYKIAKEDPEFRAAWKEALDVGTDALEDVLHEKATVGWAEEVRGPDGELIRVTQRWTPQSLIVALRARRPDQYAEKGAQIAIVNTVPGATIERTMQVDLSEVARILGEAGFRGLGGAVVDAEAVDVTALELEAGPDSFPNPSS